MASDRGIAALAALLSALPLVLTIHLRRLGYARAARVYLAEQQALGIDKEEARERILELSPLGVTFDTDDLPRWPVNVILPLGVVGVIALVVAVVLVVR